jgi:hypothetical protein
MTVLVESSDVMLVFQYSFGQDRKGVQPEEYTNIPQWQMKRKRGRSKRIQMWAREFDKSGGDLGGTK